MKEALRGNRRYWELLWQALKLSDDYERFLKSDGPGAVERYNTRLRNHRPGMKPIAQPRAFQKHGIWIAVYDRFGDVHREDFNDWWTRREKRIQASPAHYFQCCADYGEFWAGFDIDQVFANSGPIENTEDFKKKFKARFVERIRKSRLVHIVLDPEEDLVILDAKFREIVGRKRKRLARGGGPRLAEVADFLNLYRLHKKDGLDVLAIVKKVGSKTQKEAAEKKTRAWYDIKREYESRIDRGREIVESLCEGLFPGKSSGPDVERKISFL